jgi:ERCC4-type nuclease
MDRMLTGDYRVGAALVERKAVRDLHVSVIQGRFWRQVGRLSRTSKCPYLLVEGSDLDDGPLRPASVRGALLAVGELGVGVIRSASPADSALWLMLLAERAARPVRTKRVYAPERQTRTGEAMLAAVPGISGVTARALIAHFGSTRAVLAATPDEWLSVRGVGPKRAQALMQSLADEQQLS